MSNSTGDRNRVAELAGALCNRCISDEELLELDSVLLSDELLCSHYLSYCRMHIALRMELRTHRTTQRVCQQIGSAGPSELDIASDGTSPPAAPVVSFLPGMIGRLSSGWPVAYLVATVILGLGLVVAAMTHVSQPTEVALPSAASGSGAGSEGGAKLLASSIVGRITGMVECVWKGSGVGVQGSGEDTAQRLAAAATPRGTTESGPQTDLPSPAGTDLKGWPGRGAGGEGGLHLHSPIHLNDRIVLRSGLLEITYDTGAKVILQGPVTYKVDSAVGGYLAVGKLTARLEKKAETQNLPSPAGTDLKGWSGRGAGGEGSSQHDTDSNHTQLQSALTLTLSRKWARGPDSSPRPLALNPSLSPDPCPLFSVRTPTAVVTDLGTEFGVEVGRDGHTVSHVYRGSVQLQAVSRDGVSESAAQVLRKNECARVDIRGGHAIISSPSGKPVDFVRSISHPTGKIKTLDLVDVVAGGDGFSGRRNAGIDAATGKPSNIPPKSENFFVTGDGKYHRVDGLPFVDGVFVPDGSRGPVQVDSGGHVCDLFTKTANVTAGYIWAGGLIPVEKSEYHIPTTLRGVDYASSGHGLLFMHANKGITFDLDAIRRANHGWKLSRFRAVAGNLIGESMTDLGLVDFWVIVDGQVRFQRYAVNGSSGAFVINFRIGESDRFLTLAATNNTNSSTGISGDWTMFGDPRLELAPVKATAGPIHSGTH